MIDEMQLIVTLFRIHSLSIAQCSESLFENSTATCVSCIVVLKHPEAMNTSLELQHLLMKM